VPELIQGDFTAVRVIENLRPVLAEGDIRRTMQEGLLKVRNELELTRDASQNGTASSTGTAIDRVAEIALSYTLKDRQSSSIMENSSGRPVSIS
jgi:hypothetical protein